MRSELLKRLSWYLSNEENSSRKLPVFSDLDVTNLSNLFVIDTPRSVDEDLGRSVFQVSHYIYPFPAIHDSCDAYEL